MVELIMLILANYAISRTVAKEDGPFGILETIRLIADKNKPIAPVEPTTDEEWATYDKRFDLFERQNKRYSRTVGGTLAGVLGCPYCFAWYSGLVLVALFVGVGLTGIGWYSLFLWLAVVGGSNFLQQIEDK